MKRETIERIISRLESDAKELERHGLLGEANLEREAAQLIRDLQAALSKEESDEAE